MEKAGKMKKNNEERGRMSSLRQKTLSHRSVPRRCNTIIMHHRKQSKHRKRRRSPRPRRCPRHRRRHHRSQP